MTDPNEASAGRHGSSGSGGLSAADLIARNRAGQPGSPDRPGRSAHRRAATAELDTAEPATVEHQTVELPRIAAVQPVGRPISNGTATAHQLSSAVGRP